MAGGKKILIVDDETQLALAIKVRLEANGYQASAAPDGQQALDAMAKDRPDLVIMDVMMPVMDGYFCVREMNQRFGRGRIPVIVLTARDRLKELFELEGVEDYVIKPFDHDDLLLRIERVLKRRAAPAAVRSPS